MASLFPSRLAPRSALDRKSWPPPAYCQTANFAKDAHDIELRVKDAEAAAFSTLSSISQLTAAGREARDALGDAENAADSAANSAIAAQNSANYATAQADNAIAANVEASQWAEYLAGPVVNPADAPAYIQDHPFGHGLYYQPVEGGVAGLWSANGASRPAAGRALEFYYLGHGHAADTGHSNRRLASQCRARSRLVVLPHHFKSVLVQWQFLAASLYGHADAGDREQLHLHRHRRQKEFLRHRRYGRSWCSAPRRAIHVNGRRRFTGTAASMLLLRC
jgi:hypothetical protein